jgi:hypothetical protein
MNEQIKYNPTIWTAGGEMGAYSSKNIPLHRKNIKIFLKNK